jgi:CRP-like cAMP-binding protein
LAALEPTRQEAIPEDEINIPDVIPEDEDVSECNTHQRPSILKHSDSSNSLNAPMLIPPNGKPSLRSSLNFGRSQVQGPHSARTPRKVSVSVLKPEVKDVEGDTHQRAVTPSEEKLQTYLSGGRRDSIDTGKQRYTRSRAVSIFQPLPEVPHNAVLDMISKVPIFKHLTTEDKERLALCAEVRAFDPDEEVMSYGKKAGDLHVIWKGEGRVSVPTQVGTLRRGDSFGEHALVKRHIAATTTVSAACGEDQERLVTLAFSYSDLVRLGLIQSLKNSDPSGKSRTKIVKRTARSTQQSRTSNLSGGSGSLNVNDLGPRSPEDMTLVEMAIRGNPHFMDWLQLSDQQVQTMRSLMRLKTVEAGHDVIKKGEQGHTFYIVHEGLLEVLIADTQTDVRHTVRLRIGDSFGELALLYNCPRKATVRSLRPCELWVLERSQFRQIMKLKSDGRIAEYQILIDSVSLLASRRNDEEKELLADALEEVFFVKDEEVVTQGDEGDSFFMIFQGECEVRVNGMTVGNLRKGGYFGERALLNREPRAATVVVTSETATLLALDSSSFNLLLGEALEALRSDSAGAPPVRRGLRQHRSSLELIHRMMHHTRTSWSGLAIPWDRLERIGILGSGTFATVSLQRDRETKKLYALKALSKQYILRENLKDYVLNERKTMQMVDSPFVVRLHCTYRDPRYVYFLLDAALGGELFEVYHIHEDFIGNDKYAKFYTECCALGLAHLHSQRIIYRDLKLENVLLYTDGYATLTDMGLAKVVIGKTYTVCGTADYFAPETLKQVGHNRAVDWWALGVLLFSMMAGRSPFDADDVMQIYRNIVKGFKKENFPETFSGDLVDLIKGLCRKKPEERIPMGPGGVSNLHDHPWFQGLPFSAVEKRTWRAPFQPPEADLGRMYADDQRDSNYLTDEFNLRGDDATGDDATGGWDADF